MNEWRVRRRKDFSLMNPSGTLLYSTLKEMKTYGVIILFFSFSSYCQYTIICPFSFRAKRKEAYSRVSCPYAEHIFLFVDCFVIMFPLPHSLLRLLLSSSLSLSLSFSCINATPLKIISFERLCRCHHYHHPRYSRSVWMW